MSQWEIRVKKYGIKVGKEFPATLSIIKTGTCSPINFELKGLDRIDCFESRRGKQQYRFIRRKHTWGLKKCGHAYPIRGCENDPLHEENQQ